MSTSRIEANLRLFIGLSFAAVMFGPIACGDDDDDSQPTTARATATLAPESTATTANGDIGPDDPAHPASTRTGIQPVDAAIEAVLSRDFSRIQPLLVPINLACATVPSGPIPGPPKCPAGVADGTVIGAFPVTGNEGSRVAISEANTAFVGLLGSQPRLFAVYRVSAPNSDPNFPSGDYGVVFVGTGQVRGVMLSVSAAGIVKIAYGGGPTNPADFTNRVPAADFILAPAK